MVWDNIVLNIFGKSEKGKEVFQNQTVAEAKKTKQKTLCGATIKRVLIKFMSSSTYQFRLSREGMFAGASADKTPGVENMKLFILNKTTKTPPKVSSWGGN